MADAPQDLISQNLNNSFNVGRTLLPPAAFSVSARVAMQLGRESVSSSNTAVVELVKNAYDADAKRVVLAFSGLGTKNATLVVADDGHGMTERELRENWLCIGTTNKQESRISKQGRVQTGEKGLGRLGLDRLCEQTTLQTRRKLTEKERMEPSLFGELEPSAIELDIHWHKYQAKGQRLETISHDIHALEHLDFDPITNARIEFPHGTRMVLRGLKDEWTPSRLRELSDELSLMLSPFADPKDFDIVIQTGLELLDLDGPVCPSRSLLSLATWKVEAAIVPVPATVSRPASESVWIKVSSNQHSRVYEMEETSWSDWLSHGAKENALPEAKSRCGPAKFIFHVFIQVNEKDEENEESGQSAQIKGFLKANRGIRIYRDGFRVKPYGDPGGTSDWLSLSMRRSRNPAAISRKSWKVAYHQVVGAVLISLDGNPDLQDQTNREGLVDGGALTDLRIFAERIVVFFEGCAHRDYRELNPPKPKLLAESPTEKDFLEKAEEEAVKLAETMLMPGAVSDASAQAVVDAVRAAKEEAQASETRHKEQVSELKDELSMTNVLASLGIMAAYFGHERVNDAVSARQKMAELRRLIKNPHDGLFADEASKLATVDLLEAGVTRLESFARFALDTVRPWKRNEEPSDLVMLIEHAISCFRDTLARSRITVLPQEMASAWQHLGPLPVLGRRVQWECILSNLLVNSLWALRPKPADSRAISIDLEREDRFVVVMFQDSGVGLEANTESDIFRPGFSTKRDHRGRQEGTGLGLSLVRSFVEEAGGIISAQCKGSLGGAKFVIRVPLRIDR